MINVLSIQKSLIALLGHSLMVGILHTQAQELELDDMRPGLLTFSTTQAQMYKVEWASSPEGPYYSDWSSLQNIQKSGAIQAAQVPMCYRVTALDTQNPLPTKILESDFEVGVADDPNQVELGKLLFHDKILSGNRNISCATCHHIQAGTGDNLALPVGEGGSGLGIARRIDPAANPPPERVPRNAPPVYNLGAKDFLLLFHDGRLARDPEHPSGFQSPAGDDLPPGLNSLLAAQAMFPVTSGTEMAGHGTENDVAIEAGVGNLPGVWNLLAQRIRDIPEYVDRMKEVYSDVNTAEDITYVHIANAIGVYEANAFRADNSPFDQFLRGNPGALSNPQRRGMELFYGKANCASCHSGKFQTDNAFHSICMVQVGPGKGDGVDGLDDFGRFRETGDPDDMYKFRTPSLRNVALTGPYGHAGAYRDLRAVVKHHVDPLNSLILYNRQQAVLPSRPDLDAHDFIIDDDIYRQIPIYQSMSFTPVDLTENEMDDVVAFLHALTDPRSINQIRDFPMTVPSGLPVGD